MSTCNRRGFRSSGQKYGQKIAIARYFNVSVDDLLGITNDPTLVGEKVGKLRLPDGFPRSEIPALLDDAAYLIHRSTTK